MNCNQFSRSIEKIHVKKLDHNAITLHQPTLHDPAWVGGLSCVLTVRSLHNQWSVSIAFAMGGGGAVICQLPADGWLLEQNHIPC